MKTFLLTISCILLMAVSGCESNMLKSLGDDSSEEASIEEAKMALDDGNYDKAIHALSSYKESTDPEISGILASAYMGKAGLDLTYMLENIDSGSLNNFDVIASAFYLQTTASPSTILYKAEDEGTPRFIINDESILELLTNLSKAKYYLYTSLEANPDDDDLTVQLGIASALHFIIDMGHIIAEVKDCNIPINEAAYKLLFPAEPDLASLGSQVSAYLTEHEEGLNEFDGDISGLRSDLWNVFQAARVFSDNFDDEDSGITTEFNDFIADLLGLPRGTGDENVFRSAIENFDGAELVSFIKNKLLGYN